MSRYFFDPSIKIFYAFIFSYYALCLQGMLLESIEER